MFKKLCALLTKKQTEEVIEQLLPEFPVVKPAKKKPTVKKATTRKPVEAHFVPAKKKAIKKATTRLKKLSENA